MVQSQYSLSWDAYKSSICGGFSSLQQNGEFVDMTLAADGHLVKVHKVLVALASPYLKELINSAPCGHPVIFLNNISYKTLCLLLEYIYTGEVMVPTEQMSSFGVAAKSLFIKGLENIASTSDFVRGTAVDQTETSLCGSKRVSLGDLQTTLPAKARKIMKLKLEEINEMLPTKSMIMDNMGDHSEIMDETDIQNDDDDAFEKDNDVHSAAVKLSSNLQYSVSIRGALQIILNRYIYNLNTTNHRTGIRRWRCVDYRNKKCLAFAVTQNNVIVSRGHPHNHPFHDKKILSKIEKKAIFSAIEEIDDYKQKEAALDNEIDTF